MHVNTQMINNERNDWIGITIRLSNCYLLANYCDDIAYGNIDREGRKLPTNKLQYNNYVNTHNKVFKFYKCDLPL